MASVKYDKIVAPFVRNQFNYNTNQISDESGLDTGPDGGAKQSFKNEVDINTIVKQFGIGYEMPEPQFVPGTQDFTNIPDFHTAMNLRARAFEQFDAYPAHIRAKFDNDPMAFVDFSLKEENRAELADMGLLTPEALQRHQDALAAKKQETEAAAAALSEKRSSATKTPTDGVEKKN